MITTELSLPELGLLAGTRGLLGAGLGLLVADKLGAERRKGIGWALVAWLLLTNAAPMMSMMVGAWYMVFSFSKNLHLSIICQFMASLGATNVLTLSAGLVQELTPVNMRGRIISAFLMIILGLQPVAEA